MTTTTNILNIFLIYLITNIIIPYLDTNILRSITVITTITDILNKIPNILNN